MPAADAFLTRTTQRLLAALFAEPRDGGLTYSEILRRSAGGSGAIHREIRRFVHAGLVLESRRGKGCLFSANTQHPLYPELAAIAMKIAAARGAGRLEPALGRGLARKYLWWMAPDDALRDEDRLVAQVMNMGTFDDIRLVEARLGEAHMRRVLESAGPGWFDDRSWTYWHYRLGLVRPGGRVPGLPRRRFA
jgi:hypothetical protein